MRPILTVSAVAHPGAPAARAGVANVGVNQKPGGTAMAAIPA
jgi:hypothetical protein